MSPSCACSGRPTGRSGSHATRGTGRAARAGRRGIGGGRRGRHGGGGARQRRDGLDPHPRRMLRARRAEAGARRGPVRASATARGSGWPRTGPGDDLADCALLLSVMADRPELASPAEPGRLRVALSTRAPSPLVRVDAAWAAAARETGALLAGAGHTVTAAEPPYGQLTAPSEIVRWVAGTELDARLLARRSLLEARTRRHAAAGRVALFASAFLARGVAPAGALGRAPSSPATTCWSRPPSPGRRSPRRAMGSARLAPPHQRALRLRDARQRVDLAGWPAMVCPPGCAPPDAAGGAGWSPGPAARRRLALGAASAQGADGLAEDGADRVNGPPAGAG